MPKSLPPGIHTLKMVDPKTLKPNLLNWRKHPQAQRSRLNAIMAQVGWADAIIVNDTTGHLVDGHLRLEEALKRKEKLVPVLYGTWTVEQEKLILATKDPLAAMAQTNADALAALTEGQTSYLARLREDHSSTLVKLNRELSHHAEEVNEGESPAILLQPKARKGKAQTPETSEPSLSDRDVEPSPPESIYETTVKEDIIFPIENVWGIPHLRPDMLCQSPPRMVWDRSPDSTTSDAWYCYSAGPSTIPSPPERTGGTLGFFTEDFRFMKAWNASADFLAWLEEMDFTSVCAPDFSGWENWPLAIRIYNLYRSRWCARFWQEAGIHVLPILQGFGDAEALAPMIFDTLPSYLPVAAVQCRTTEDWRGFVKFLKLARSHVRIDTLVVYGGVDKRKYLEGRLPIGKTGFKEVIYLESYIARRRKGMPRKAGN